MHLPLPVTSDKWNHTLCGCLCGFSHQAQCFQVLPCCSCISTSFLLFLWLGWNSHHIKAILLMYTILWRLVHSQCCAANTSVEFWIIFAPQKKTQHPLIGHSSFPPSPALATTNLFSVFVDLPILDISYKWNLKTCVFLCLTSLHYKIRTLDKWSWSTESVLLCSNGQNTCSAIGSLWSRENVWETLPSLMAPAEPWTQQPILSSWRLLGKALR